MAAEAWDHHCTSAQSESPAEALQQPSNGRETRSLCRHPMFVIAKQDERGAPESWHRGQLPPAGPVSAAVEMQSASASVSSSAALWFRFGPKAHTAYQCTM
ncbi:hypothetical protein BU16DRAFT_522187 [Lophium mytilinum]|uniref:Uncharacterized protein n=1 Tax=Lophium mytilinum TaxID=390894 RepID=A0A6A6R974_9PEZI|nr:hypothetical protein BU16DRAFT_522187 [Lophium mytilinum]